jgi:hypothetical protein
MLSEHCLSVTMGGPMPAVVLGQMSPGAQSKELLVVGRPGGILGL